MADPRPDGGGPPALMTLLSQALVAFTIELDNEFERLMPHRTTNHGSTPGAGRVPWLVSVTMWANCLRYVPESGVPAGELARRARIPDQAMQGVLKRMSEWWGYLTVAADPADTRGRPPRSAWLVRPTRAGRQAQGVWEPLAGVVEDRWRARFGRTEVDALRAALGALVSRFDVDLPDCLPIGRHSHAWRHDPAVVGLPPSGLDPDGVLDLPLTALLSKVLLAFALDFEEATELPPALGANVLRVLHEPGVPVRDLSRLSGVAAMGVENSLSLLEKQHYLTLDPDPAGGRTKIARLTAKGREAQDTHHRQVGATEQRWEARFGGPAVPALRASLEGLVTGEGEGDYGSLLLRAVEPYPEGWRSQLPAPATLPHYPVVSHRGGFPDGS